ncbi:uncharacterized protein LOC112692824 [Sipha flava]|uniref:Uncharacterized protein LOC112692824 n=1 Tax=Sipha flava TaxID=143950 RepID=A0A2S2QJK0_9HEMI|nr:uncharacterized protein LOC112692824 [Sipha flava]
MIKNLVFCLAVITFSRFDCKCIKNAPNIENPGTIMDKVIKLQNETINLQKNSTISTAQKNETIVKNNNLEAKHKSKIRQVSADTPIIASTLIDDMNAEQSYYPSPLMVYPFPMMNTYYPRYFPYIYPGNQGNHFFG